MLKKILLYTLSGVLVLLTAAGGGGYWYVNRALPVVTGEIVAGVTKPVRIDRDQYGIPHIYADNDHDLYYGQGYAQAQDRLLQLELTRRAVSGRLSELMGEATIPTDRFYRTIGFQRAAEESAAQLPDDTRRHLQAFADGVNAFIADAESAGKLPVEFKLLGVKPEPWQIADSLAIGKLMAWDLGGNLRTELLMSLLIPHVGESKALSLVPFAHNLKPEDLKLDHLVALQEQPTADLIDILADARDMGTPGEGIGSNNWVVSGEKSESGKPLLASDMHLMMGAPSIFYQNELSSGDGETVYGAIFPGVPGVIVGRNSRISWAFTNGMTDVQDLYIEKPNPSNPRQFEYNGVYEDAKVHPQEIKVKGKESVKFDVLVTRHGPIITDLLSEMQDSDGLIPQGVQKVAKNITQPLALRWSALEPSNEIGAMLRFNKAKDWTQFETAMRDFHSPVQNVIFADIDGNIAYRHNGHVPIRKKGTGLAPVPGWTDEYEWTGYIPWEELPQSHNPSEGYIATANNNVADASYPYILTHEWEPDYRVDRITEMLNAKDDLTLDDFGKMHTDWYNKQAKQNLPLWLPLLEQGEWTEVEREALEALKEWAQDPIDDPDLIGPSIYHTMYLKVAEQIYKPQLGDKLFLQYMRTGLPNNALDALFQEEKPVWFDGTQQTKEDAVRAGFQAAVAELQNTQGSKPSKWKWGKLHNLTLQHPLGAVKPLNLLYNEGPFPIGGSNSTVGMGGYSKTRPYAMGIGAPWRFVVDMKQPSGSRDVLALGNSAQLGSDHYNDQLDLWLEGQYKETGVVRKGTLILQPGAGL